MDKIEQLSKRLKEVKECFDKWQNSGLNEDILIIYLHHKLGRKISVKDIKKMLQEQKNFFDNLIKDEVVKRLEK